MSGSPDPPLTSNLESILVATLAAVETDGLLALDTAVARYPQHAHLLRAAVAALNAPQGSEAAATVPLPVLPDFELGAEIGRGSMGVVYAARQISLGRRAAVKLLSRHLAADTGAVARFRREAQAVARLRHPGIVQVHAFGEAAGQPWLAMELVEGVPLDRVLASLRAAPGQCRTGRDLGALVESLCAGRVGTATTTESSGMAPWAGEQVAILTGIAAQVADALAYAHTQGVVHRDVKPSNILLRADGSALLVDFGLAHDDLGASLTQTGQFAGTPQYMAPEQTFEASATSPVSDVFSLGAVLYEMLTLDRPFAAGSQSEVLQRVRQVDPVRPSRRNPSVTQDLEAVLQKSLEKQPAARYAGADLFAADLRAALRGELVTARRLGPTRRLLRRARRQPLATALVLLLVFGVPAMTALVGMLWVQRPMVAMAEANAAFERRERLLVQVHDAMAAQAPQAALAALGDAPRDDRELLVWRAAALAQAGCVADAWAVVEQAELAPTTRLWVQQLVRCRAGELAAARIAEPGLPDPTEPLAWWVAATAIAARAKREHDATAFRRVQTLLLRAHLAAPRPRLSLLHQMSLAVHYTGDRELARGIAAALCEHGGSSAEALVSRGQAELLFAPAAAERTAAAARAAGAPLAACALMQAGASQAQGRPDAALAALAVVPASDERYGDVCYQRALLSFELGDLQSAQAGFETALQRDPRSVIAALGLASVHNRRQDVDAVLATLAPFVDVHPQLVRLQNNYAEALFARGRCEEALAHLDRAITADPDYDYAPRTKARVLASLGRVAEARQVLAAAVQARPQSGFRWHAQAMFELDTEGLPARDLDGAAMAARRATGLSEVNKHVYHWDLVRVLAAANRWLEVRAECQLLQAALGAAMDTRSQLIAQKVEEMLQRAAAAR